MSRSTRIIALAAVAALAACSDRTSPDPLADDPLAARAATSERGEVARERLARRLARALADPGFRAELKRELDRSPVAERKLHLQRFLSAADRRALRAVARLNGESASAVHADAREAIPLELYFPVPEHRSAWRGDAHLLVATAADDHEAPVAFAPSGRRRILDPDAPPDVPVLAVVPVETDFDRASLPRHILPAPGGTPKLPAGLQMTRAHFQDDFEGWLKGNPEFEVHVLGQSGSSDSLTSYACAGEHAGGYYTFDQNGADWSGNVLLFSQAQIDSYKRLHPNQNLRLFVVEDDDGACQIKTDSRRFAALVTAVEAAYPLLTGGRDSTAGLQKYWKRANALQKILKALGSLITTSDDLVGNAVESSVTGASYPGANWVVKGDKNATNGWLNLVVR
ncbi:MAG: hypothetical protein H0T44_14875 [Gemmatimonadales bacterium]|nr:hypothetical protein [Gemmatimonadales bacterium]